MKLSKLLLTAVATLSISVANATISLEVAPLQAGVKAQVLGVRAGFNGRSAVAFTGRTAANLARTAVSTGKYAGLKAFDASSQMLVATGSEVASLTSKTFDTVEGSSKLALATSAAFANQAVGMVSSALSATQAVLNLNPASGAKTVAKGLVASATNTVTIVSNAGAEVLNAGEKVLSDSAEAVFGALGIARETVKSSSSLW